MEFRTLRELITKLPDEESCRAYLAKQRWPDGVVICPHCSYNKCYVICGGEKYKCAKKGCYKKFSVKVGTIFEASNIPLTKWFVALYLATAHKKGISSYQLAKDIGVSQKCSWFMLHRIREMMRPKEEVKLDNIVEIDEVYIGGSVSNMSKSKRKKIRDAGTMHENKVMVMGMIERGGALKLISTGSSSGNEEIRSLIQQNVDKDAVIMTDTSGAYVGLNKEFAGHETINHAQQEYVREEVIYTNTIEGAFSHLKRSIFGIYHKATVKHLSRYCEETAFRYNLRKMTDPDRFIYALRKIGGRLDYKTLIASPLPKIELRATLPALIMEKQGGKGIPVLQLKNGQIIGRYPSIKEAALINKIDPAKIRRVLLGEKRSTGGYQWKYA